MNPIDTRKLLTDYERDGFVVIPKFLSTEEVADVRAELDRYIREDLASLPPDAASARWRRCPANCPESPRHRCRPQCPRSCFACCNCRRQ